MVNILNFGGGAFVGTAYMLGSLLAFDQVLVLPNGFSEKKSFFDYATQAGVSFDELEFRCDEVIGSMPSRVSSGLDDCVSKTFSVAQGISGGSLLAWSVLGEVPLAHLTKSVLEFDARIYFNFKKSDIKDFFSAAPLAVSNLAFGVAESLFSFASSGSNGDFSAYLFRNFSKLLFDSARSIKNDLPSGIFSGDGLEQYVCELSKKHDKLSVNFSDFEAAKKHLIIIAERLNYVRRVKEQGLHESEVYFGINPYTDVSVSKAIRASCSLPFILKPAQWYDAVLKKNFQLVDGGASKTIGFRKINELYPNSKVWVLFNPIVPHESSVSNVFDLAEQVLRKMIYNRKCVVWDRLEEDIKAKTLLFGSDSEFRKSLFAWPDMKEALWHGYWHGLESIRKRYDEFSAKLLSANLDLVPKNLIDKYIVRNNQRKQVYGC